MQGITAYDSEEEEEKEEPKPAPVGAQAPGKEPVPKPKAVPPAASAKKAQVAATTLSQLRKEISGAKSATATVQVVRKALDTSWDSRWAAQALYKVAVRSTARTRKEWAGDKAVLRLAGKLQEEAASYGVSSRRDEDVETLLLSLEGLRRMGLQDPEAQKEVLGRVFSMLDADSWRHPVKSLARLFWLGASVKLEGCKELPSQLRRRYAELSGPDAALLVAAMQHEGGRDAALLQKVLARLKAEGVHAGCSATDLVEMSEGLKALGVDDEGTLRPLGQEALRRRAELTPDESHRIHTAFQAMKLPLPQVWAKVGVVTKRGSAEIVSTQAFEPQEGHQKKRRGNNELERTSPPRVVRDYKMCSY